MKDRTLGRRREAGRSERHRRDQLGKCLDFSQKTHTPTGGGSTPFKLEKQFHEVKKSNLETCVLTGQPFCYVLVTEEREKERGLPKRVERERKTAPSSDIICFWRGLLQDHLAFFVNSNADVYQRA